MAYNNDLSQSCSSGKPRAVPNSLNMNIRSPGRREPVESDENDPMSYSMNSQVSCMDNTAVACCDNGCSALKSQESCIDNTVGCDSGYSPDSNVPPPLEPVICVRIIPENQEDGFESFSGCPYRPNLPRDNRLPPAPQQPDMDVSGGQWGGGRPKVPSVVQDQYEPYSGNPYTPDILGDTRLAPDPQEPEAQWGGTIPNIPPPNSKERYNKYAEQQVKILSTSARRYLANALNYEIQGMAEAGYLKNWRGLAELMSKDFSYTMSLDDRERDPTGVLLKDWQTERGSTIGKLVDYLNTLDRYDILDDMEFFKFIKRSVDDHNDRMKKTDEDFQRQERRRPQTAPITVDDVEGKAPTNYTAFVCYEEGDEDFVMEMIEELEMRPNSHIKLCLNARDLLIGGNEAVVTAELIKSRCEKTIVVLSPKFVREDSEMCQFAMNVSHSLNPAARKSKIVPLMAQECEIPASLCHITPVDFTRSLQRKWQWRKVSACLMSCDQMLNYAEKASLRRIIYNAPTRSMDLRASVRASMKRAGEGRLAAGTVIVSAEDSPMRKRQGKSPTSSASSEGAEEDNADGVDGAMKATPKPLDPKEIHKVKDKKRDKRNEKERSREKKKNAKLTFHFSRIFRNQ